MKSFSQCLLGIADRHGIQSVFSDFLEMAICALSAGAKEDRYREIVSRYTSKEVQMLAEAFAYLVNEMDNDGDGLKDCLGDFFMEHISHGHNGQFFTPEPICDMMAMITNTTGTGRNIADCACGSGRTLMAAARISRMNKFYGADIDRNCCMMAVINFCLNGMLGEVAWMDSLSNRFYGGWKIELDPLHLVPVVYEIGESESSIVLRLPEIANVPIVPALPEPLTVAPVQASLFDHWQF